MKARLYAAVYAAVVVGAVVLAWVTSTPDPTRRPTDNADDRIVLTSAQMYGPEIFDGEPVKPGAFGAVVGLTYDSPNKPLCTGTLIAPTMVLTAAHCVCKRVPNHVFVGDIPGTGPGAGLSYPVVDYRPGLFCKRQTSRNGVDIAVLQLGSAVKGVDPIPFASDAVISSATEFRIVGFGAIDAHGRKLADRKRQAAVPVISVSCSNADKTLFGCQVGQEIVAGKNHGPDSCTGDSGGPLLVSAAGDAGVPTAKGMSLAGVTSRSVKPAASACGVGGVYERLLPKIITWINRAMESMAST